MRWLNRYMSNAQQNSDMRAISFSTLAHSLQGANPVMTINDISSSQSQYDDHQQNSLQNIYNQQITNQKQVWSLIQKHGNLALSSMSDLSNISTLNYTTDHGAVYPTTLYGQQLKDIAQLIKADVGLEVATVSNSGWDHHAKQGGAQGDQANKLKEFSSGIEALYKDLGSQYMSNVVILTVSEFGRTAKQNASLGTDHGNASTWFVIGEQINGGIYGQWPGLLPDQLYQNRYLAHTINFTDIYAELLTKHLGVGARLPVVLPSSQYLPIGFLS